MKKSTKQFAAMVAMSLIVSQGSWAGEDTGQNFGSSAVQATLISSAFEGLPVLGVQILDEDAMNQTQGELWPWIIGVATLDLTLASFFWGNYAPTVASAGGLCVNCDIGNKSR